MERQTATKQSAHDAFGGGDEFDDDDDDDDLFDYDIDQAIRTVDTSIPEIIAPASAEQSKGRSDRAGESLGVDEEVKIRKRKVAVKLDEHRLLSEVGIPKLRELARTKLKLRGKGYEYKDLSRIVAFYQLWADDLFPKARFLDTLAIIEKLGHSKTLQRQRQEWIDQEMQASGAPDPVNLEGSGNLLDETKAEAGGNNGASVSHPGESSANNLEQPGSTTTSTAAAATDSLFLQMDEEDIDDYDPTFDDLENALRNQASAQNARSAEPEVDEFEDELEVMRELDS